MVSGTFPEFPYNSRGEYCFAWPRFLRKEVFTMSYSTTPFVTTQGVPPGCSRSAGRSPRISATCLVCVLLFLLAGGPGLAGQSSPRKVPPAPETKVDAVEEILHGVKLADPYRWLEDQQSPATRAWIDGQNRHTDELLGKVSGRDRISRRLGELMKVDSIGLPTARGSRYFFTKQEARRDLPVICLREGKDGADETLIDPHKLSPDGSKTVSLLDVSHDGKLLAYGIRIGGEDELEVHFFDVDNRTDIPDVLERGRYFGVSLSRDKQTLFYARHGGESSRVFRRGLGAGAENETQIFGDGYDAGVGISPCLSEDGRYLLINVWYGSAPEIPDIQDLSGKNPIVPIVKDIEARFSGEAVDNRLFVQTNWQAPNGRILEINLENPDSGSWKEIIREQKSAVIQGFSLVGKRLYVNYLDNVVASSVRVICSRRALRYTTFRFRRLARSAAWEENGRAVKRSLRSIRFTSPRRSTPKTWARIKSASGRAPMFPSTATGSKSNRSPFRRTTKR